MREASFYFKHTDDSVRCFLCAHTCHIAPGERGRCGVRENRNGSLWSLVYGRPVAQHIDPIEKKPLYHFYPGSLSYSYGTVGCNFHCLFCQNADIAHAPKNRDNIRVNDVKPEDIVREARETGCYSVAATYTEPTIFMEYALDICRLGKEFDLKQVFVTNGFMTPKAVQAAVQCIDAANVDLKSFRNSFYIEECAGRLAPVLKTIRSLKEAGVWVEVTTLIIPGQNDDPGELRDIAGFIASLGAEIPWHISAFHPAYRRTDRPPTPAKTLFRARDIGLEAGLRYVYCGNLPGVEFRNTYCHGCGRKLIDRTMGTADVVGLKAGRCLQCRETPAGVGLA
ncbi:MAG: AmmeMemoRadiSam system radical SAM enzyme [Desulfohalobiaceae bacterium]|nr:AmmeMemoRadiSam system radical SAM enzyme [Desulfohalobiaceae bacterium]